MANRSKSLTNKRGEVRELRGADFDRAIPFSALPASLRTKLRKRGPQKTPTKEPISIRLSPPVVRAFRATGRGWQTRMDRALQDWLKHHKPNAA